jgi:hypothetical protein
VNTMATTILMFLEMITSRIVTCGNGLKGKFRSQEADYA